MNDTSMNGKTPVVAYLLWFFLGGFGAHRFYMGRIGSGAGMAGLLVGSVVLSAVIIGLIGFPVLFAWWLVDAYLINKWFKEGEGAQNETVVGNFASTDTSGTPGAPTDEPLRDAA